MVFTYIGDAATSPSQVDEALELAGACGLNLCIGDKLFTNSYHVVVEYSKIPGEPRGVIPTGTAMVVLGWKTHAVDGCCVVAACVPSMFGNGVGWIIVCRDGVAFVATRIMQSQGSASRPHPYNDSS